MRQLMLYLTQGLPAGTAVPAWGATVYMPLPIAVNLEGNQVETEVRVTNDSSVSRAFSYSFVPGSNAGSAGERRIRRVVKTVRPHATVLLGEVVKGRPGILEIDADSHFAITSQLIGTTLEGVRRIGPVMPLVSAPLAGARCRAGSAR